MPVATVVCGKPRKELADIFAPHDGAFGRIELIRWLSHTLGVLFREPVENVFSSQEFTAAQHETVKRWSP